MEADVLSAGELDTRLRRAIEDRLDSLGLQVFDWKLAPRPSTSQVPGARWGGYRAEFKLISREHARALGGNLEDLRRQAIELTGSHQRVFQIDISKFEFCRGSSPVDVDGYELRVYTPAMIAAEKLRAICQQMPEYARRTNPAPRPRDFYDIHAIVEHAGVDLGRESELVGHMFDAKDVPYSLLGLLERDRERQFHGQEWAAVVNAVRGTVQPFDHYFDFVCRQAKTLQALWVAKPPLG
jgi:hypothetical protein